MTDKGARISTDELRKAAEEAENDLRELIKAEQQKLFGDPHHVGYSRTNASGTVSQIAANNPRQVLEDIRRPKKGETTTFGQRLAAHGRANNASPAEIGRAMDGMHDTEVAYSTNSHAAHDAAYRAHTEAAKQAKDPIYKLHHEEKAEQHRTRAVENPQYDGESYVPGETVAQAPSPTPGNSNADYYGVEAYGQKGMKSASWRKTFKDSESLRAWTEKNDAAMHGMRPLDKNEAHPQSTGGKDSTGKVTSPPTNKSLAEEADSCGRLLKAHVKAYQRTTASGASVSVKEHDDARQAHPHGDANRTRWDRLPDEENPAFALHGASSHDLAKVAQGKEDLNRRAKVALSNRGLDSDAKWIGFDKADEHHKITKEENARNSDEDDAEGIGGVMQGMHRNILSVVAKGHLDLNKQAKHELASRGHDSNGKWIGFDAAAKHHGIK